MVNWVRMTAQAEHQYAGRRLRAGDEYDCEEQHVELMRKLGWASPSEAKAEVQRRQYRRRDLQAQP